ncbi:flavin reductase family protein [Anaplasma capra]|uniref:flavin reductase family protein n=1 Tax=Anaplasma capra TaxID=1562740 RepID=UPI0021D5BC9C|nr:flavin reductase family protein [Anaplasma capra]MCU7611498.1 flavin reductase family protein [Anaplasma capra]MCU7612063.1 flavin reductase family protein [Anaplasma capra]
MRLSGVSPELFKSCMGRFATGVTVVTTVDCHGVMHGVTVSSFNSVSLNPPLVLFSIEKSSSRFGAFSSCARFIVNILGESQADISADFANRSRHHWENHDFVTVDGMPVIGGAITYLHCAMHHLYDGGDHKIVVGEVLDCKALTDEGPLLYYRGEYCALNR